MEVEINMVVITVRHRDGGHKQRIRILDYKSEAPGTHDVVRIEYDPGCSALSAQPTVAPPSYITTTQMLSTNKNGATYIVATDSEGLRAGDQFERFRRGIYFRIRF